MVEPVCILLNRAAGRAAAIETQLAAEIAAHPGRYRLCRLAGDEGITAAAAQAAARGHRIVAVAGGDGSARAAAEGLVGTKVALALLPAGTFNHFARSLDLPTDPGTALALTRIGERRALDVGRLNGHVFLNNASLGIYPAILARRERFYRRWGRSRLAAYISVALALLGMRRPKTLALVIDGARRRTRTPLAFVALNGGQLHLFGLAGTDCIEAGRLAVFAAPDAGRWGLLRYAVLLLGRRMRPRPGIERFCGDDIVIPGAQRRRVALDGERMRLDGPFRIRRERAALAVLVVKR